MSAASLGAMGRPHCPVSLVNKRMHIYIHTHTYTYLSIFPSIYLSIYKYVCIYI